MWAPYGYLHMGKEIKVLIHVISGQEVNVGIEGGRGGEEGEVDEKEEEGTRRRRRGRAD